MKSISVGIPAFNEAANIGYLINDLLSQTQRSFVLKEIIISSDGSTDKTGELVKKINNKKIVLMDHKQRKGRAVRQNEIMRKCDADILVLVDADILIKDRNFLSKIVQPIFSGNVDLTSASVKELKPQNFLEEVLESSMKFKKYIFENYKNGNNLFTCHGRGRAFSKKLYKKIKFSESNGEDAYSYFFAVTQGYKYQFVKNTCVYYKLPGNFKDHENQSIRFYKTQRSMEKSFGNKVVAQENFMTPQLILSSLAKYFLKDPRIGVYFLIAVFLKIKSLLAGKINDAWLVSPTSKSLRKETI